VIPKRRDKDSCLAIALDAIRRGEQGEQGEPESIAFCLMRALMPRRHKELVTARHLLTPTVWKPGLVRDVGQVPDDRVCGTTKTPLGPELNGSRRRSGCIAQTSPNTGVVVRQGA
jgi:hypothetical protein